MNRITKITGVLAVVMTLSTSGAFAADSKCGAIPNPPDVPADGAALTSKEMDTIAAAFDDYQEAFAKFNKCAVEEFNTVQKGFESVIDAYAAKGKKK
jgi:hypothetical protein